MSYTEPLHEYRERVQSDDRRLDVLLLAGLLLAGLLLRWLLFDVVGVWGDFGFYVYDAKLILDGQTPFVDFLGRSPLFLFTYAGVTQVTGEFVRTLRWFAIAWYLLTAPAVYLIGLRLRGRRVAGVATALFLLTPFSIAYGVRASTQSMALCFSIWGLYALVRNPRSLGAAVAGAGIGLGFLARQSVIAIAGGVGLWLLWRAYREDWSLARTVARCGALSAAFVAVVFAGYFAVMGGHLGRAIALFDQQVMGLFLTSGRGGWPLIGVEFPTINTQAPDGAIPVVNHICPQCSARTARVFASTTVAAAPVVGLLGVWYLRDWTDRFFSDQLFVYFAGAMVALQAYAVATALLNGFWYRPLTVVGLLALAAIAWQAPPLPRQHLYGRLPSLLVLVGFALSAGYLVRDRMVANYYFLDFWPVVCLLAGLLLVVAWEWVGSPDRWALSLVLGLLLVTSLFGAHPLAATALDSDQNANKFTMDRLERYGDDLDNRVAPGEAVFAGHPTYIVGSHAEMPMDDPRIHYRYSTFSTKDGPQWPAAKMFDHVKPRLADGRYEYVILDTMTARILQYQEILTDEFTENYCRVDHEADLYAGTGSQLYRYGDCGEERRPTWAIMETIARAEYNATDA